MTRHLRGAWSRRRVLLPLFLLTTLVVAGVVTVVGLAGTAGTPASLVVPLLVLGAVAVPTTSRELAVERRHEVALARLRGLEGLRLHAVLAVEPVVALLLAGAAGTAVGAAGAWLVGHWAGAGATTVGPRAVSAGLAVVAVALLAVVLGAAAALREPLGEQLAAGRRPRRSGVAALFGSVLVLVAAVVAVYRSSRVADGAEPDWVVLAAPALVGLAVGQLAVWGVRLLARVAVRRTDARAVPTFLAVRRMARVADGVEPLRVLVAAVVVAALAGTAASQVSDWAGDEARLRQGAPLQVRLTGTDALGAVALTRELDPGGRWLMAAVLVPGPGSGPARRAFLDTERYAAVVGGFLDGTPAAGVAGRLGELGGGQDRTVPLSGAEVGLTVQGVSRRRAGDLRPVVRLAYRDDDGVETTVPFRLRIGLDGAPVEAGARLPSCEVGCVLTSVTLDRAPGSSTLPYLLTGLRVDGEDVLERTFGEQGERRDAPVLVENGLLAPSESGPLRATAAGAARTLPVLVTDGTEIAGSVDSPGGDERRARTAGRLPALPLVEAEGVLADLPLAAAGADPTVPAAEVLVLARADTPATVLDPLTDAAGGPARTLDDAERAVAAESGAARARVYGFIGGCCLLVALLVLGTSVARQRTEWHRDAAALRSAGTALDVVRRSGRLETLWLAAAAVAATVAGSVLATGLLLGDLALVRVPEHAVALRSGLAALPLVVAGLVAAAVVVLVTGRGRRTEAAATHPVLLNEAAQR